MPTARCYCEDGDDLYEEFSLESGMRASANVQKVAAVTFITIIVIIM